LTPKVISFPSSSRSFVLECHECVSSKRNIISGSKIIFLLIFHSKLLIDWYKMTCSWGFSWRTSSHIVEWRKQQYLHNHKKNIYNYLFSFSLFFYMFFLNFFFSQLILFNFFLSWSFFSFLLPSKLSFDIINIIIDIINIIVNIIIFH